MLSSPLSLLPEAVAMLGGMGNSFAVVAMTSTADVASNTAASNSVYKATCATVHSIRRHNRHGEGDTRGRPDARRWRGLRVWYGWCLKRYASGPIPVQYLRYKSFRIIHCAFVINQVSQTLLRNG